VIDFISGCTYALGGTMQKLGHNIFLCAPENIDVQGQISDALAEMPQGPVDSSNKFNTR